MAEEESQLPKLRIMQTCPIDFGECKKREEIEKEFNPSQVFLDIPYSGYNKEYENAIKKAIESFGLTPVLAETSAKVEGLLCNVCKTIQKSGYAVADISEHNPNILYELGIIHSVGKKCCILCESDKKMPVDLSGLIIHKYRDIEDIEKSVSKWINDNVGNLSSKKTEEQMKIFEMIFYHLERKEFSGIPNRIREINVTGDMTPLINNYNRVIGIIIDFLDDGEPKVRSGAAKALGQIGDSRAIEPLLEALKDEDSNVRSSVAVALGEIGDSKAVEPLVAALKVSNIKDKWAVIDALGKIGVAVIEPLIESFKDESLLIKLNVFYVLDKIGKPAIEPLITSLNDEDPSIRSFSANSLGGFGDGRAVEPLIAILSDTVGYVQRAGIEALGEIGDKRAVEPLTKFLDDDILGHEAERAIEKIKSAQKKKKKE